MISKEYFFLKIDDYLDGNMSKEEILIFENEILNNTELQNEVALNKEMRIQYSEQHWSFVDVNSAKKKIEEIENIIKSPEFEYNISGIEDASNTYFEGEKFNNKTKNNYKRFYVLAIAASFVLFIGLFFLNNNQNLYMNYNSWDNLPSLIERGVDQNKTLQDAEVAFVNKDYTAANTLYNTHILNSNTTNTNVYLYYGITQLELNQNDKALDTFDKIINSNALDSSKGFWYKTLVYLKAEDKLNAIKQLEIIVSNTENYNYNEAKKLLEKLKN